MTIEYIVFFAIYIPSLILSWCLTRSYLIKYRYQRANLSDAILVLLPIANTIMIFHYYRELEIRFKFNAIWFFLIKKVNK